MMMKNVLLFICLFMTGTACNMVYAQERKMVKKGNELYENKNYKAAAEAYQKAIQQNPKYTPGLFNLGNALYQQKQYEQARKVLDATSKISADKKGKDAASYNIGNTYMQEQKWQDAINAYKEALRNNPQDADAKYNLSYALSMLKKQQGGGDDNNKDKNDKNKNDKNKDNKENKDNKDNKKDQDKQGDNQKDQDKKEDQQQNQQDKKEGDKDKEKKPQPQQSKLSQQQAEQLLNALQQEEKKLQDKMQKEKGVPVKVDKDW